MVRGARILRVTRVAARLDCLQRLSNPRRIEQKQTISSSWRDKPISNRANCREHRGSRGKLFRHGFTSTFASKLRKFFERSRAVSDERDE